ncbi:MAG: SEC-C metal-binding domain-containing protein [Chloroflexota bacterium]
MPRGDPSKVLAVRIPQTQYGSLKSEARRRRMRLSDYVRRLLGAEADRLSSTQGIVAKDETSEAVAVSAPDRAFAAPAGGPSKTWVGIGRKVGGNEYCPCGSGRKYKRCHGRMPG